MTGGTSYENPGPDELVPPGASRRLGALVDATGLIISDLDLPVVRRRIAECAAALAPGCGCVVVLLDADGEVAAVTSSAIESDEVARVERGLIASVSFPIRSDVRPLGALHVVPPVTAAGAVAQVDPAVAADLEALARAAAVALHNAELFEESRRRQHWLEASAEIVGQLLYRSTDAHFDLTARKVSEVIPCDVVTIAVCNRDRTSIQMRVALGRPKIVGWVIPTEGSLTGRVVSTGEAVRLRNLDEAAHLPVPGKAPHGDGPTMVLPMIGSAGVRGVLGLMRAFNGPPFSPLEFEFARGFAGQAALALELTEARRQHQRSLLMQDRQRIARDLHDHVIQRLFAAGLGLQGVAGRLADQEQGERLLGQVGEIDLVIRELRSSIRRLRGPLAVSAPPSGTVAPDVDR